MVLTSFPSDRGFLRLAQVKKKCWLLQFLRFFCVRFSENFPDFPGVSTNGHGFSSDPGPCARFSSLIRARLILAELLASANGSDAPRSFVSRFPPLSRRRVESGGRLKPSERRRFSFPLPRLLASSFCSSMHTYSYSHTRGREFTAPAGASRSNCEDVAILPQEQSPGWHDGVLARRHSCVTRCKTCIPPSWFITRPPTHLPLSKRLIVSQHYISNRTLWWDHKLILF